MSNNYSVQLTDNTSCYSTTFDYSTAIVIISVLRTYISGFDVEVVLSVDEQDNIMEFLHSGRGETIRAKALGGHLGNCH